MIPRVNNHNEEVEAYLLAEFKRFDECCGVVAPPIFAVFVVESPLQTPGNWPNILPGKYYVSRPLEGGVNSHVIMLWNFETEKEIQIVVGYCGFDESDPQETKGGSCVDWRGIKKVLG